MEGLLKRQNSFNVTKVICRQSRLTYFLFLIFHFLFLFIFFFSRGRGMVGWARWAADLHFLFIRIFIIMTRMLSVTQA